MPHALIGPFEVNDAFAGVVAAWLSGTDADPEKMNPNGGGVRSGSSGGRPGSSSDGFVRRTICQGGGAANAAVPETL